MPKEIYAHHVLLSTAHHLLENVEKKEAANDIDGITLECVACLVMCAACVEALVNYVGHARDIDGWNGNAPLPRKITLLFGSADLEYNEDNDPLLSLTELRRYRNTVMHGKAEISDDVELDENGYPSLDISWSEGIDPSLCRYMFDQTKAFHRMLFEAFEIGAQEDMTFAIASVR